MVCEEAEQGGTASDWGHLGEVDLVLRDPCSVVGPICMTGLCVGSPSHSLKIGLARPKGTNGSWVSFCCPCGVFE